jgi:DNA-binding PadR family transcriptional regulator
MTSATFHILLALADQDRHGYAIMREVELRSGGDVKLGPGTLYGAIQRLLEQGWIVETDGRAGEDPGERRRYYHFTRDGRTALKDEASRLKDLVRMAEKKRILPA